MREILSKIWYYGTLPIWWFFIVITSDVLTKIFWGGAIISGFVFLLTYKTTYEWLLFSFMCVCCAGAMWFAGIFYGFLGEIIVRLIRIVQGWIDGVDYSEYDAQ